MKASTNKISSTKDVYWNKKVYFYSQILTRKINKDSNIQGNQKKLPKYSSAKEVKHERITSELNQNILHPLPRLQFLPLIN